MTPTEVSERLAAAGLLGATSAPRIRPSDAEVEAAGKRAAAGTPLDELISTGRQEPARH